MTFNYIYNSIQLLFGRRDETLYYCHYFIETFFSNAVYLADLFTKALELDSTMLDALPLIK